MFLYFLHHLWLDKTNLIIWFLFSQRDMDPYDLSARVLDRIEDLLRGHSRSRKVDLDYKTRKKIEHRFFIKFREGSNHHAHICLIYNKRECVSLGINSVKHHAEVDALKKLLATNENKKKGYYGMVTIRFSKTGVFNNSSPCFHCSQFLRKHLDFFHSISFSDQHGHLCILTSDMFHHRHFCHISKGHLCRQWEQLSVHSICKGLVFWTYLFCRGKTNGMFHTRDNAVILGVVYSVIRFDYWMQFSKFITYQVDAFWNFYR